jgi:HAD superfamily hydrolase (TIGR01509 family)
LKAVRPFEVYIFDVDGTLLDSAADICGAIQEVIDRAQRSPEWGPVRSGPPLEYVPEPLPFDYLKSFIGFHLDNIFTEVLPDASRVQLDGMIAAYREIYLARKHAGTRRYPGVVEALGNLAGRKGTATTKGTPTTRAVLEQFGLLTYFDHVQGTDGFPCKPAPDVLLRSIEALGAKPEDCVFVGDSAADMEAGRRAGVQICAVDYGYGSTEALAKWKPDFWISDLRELCSEPVEAA